jgi:hypothetical protein
MGLAAMRQIRDTGGLGMNTAKAEMSTTWKTKYGPRRVRHDPPTLEEAIFAARGLTDDLQEQIEFAAGLMEAPVEEVRAAIMKSPAPRKPAATLAFTSRGGTERSVVVERKAPRRMLPGRPVTGRSLGQVS